MKNDNKKIKGEDYYKRKRTIKRKYKVFNALWCISRIVLFPIFLIIRIWRWTYYQD